MPNTEEEKRFRFNWTDKRKYTNKVRLGYMGVIEA